MTVAPTNTELWEKFGIVNVTIKGEIEKGYNNNFKLQFFDPNSVKSEDMKSFNPKNVTAKRLFDDLKSQRRQKSLPFYIISDNGKYLSVVVTKTDPYTNYSIYSTKWDGDIVNATEFELHRIPDPDEIKENDYKLCTKGGSKWISSQFPLGTYNSEGTYSSNSEGSYHSFFTINQCRDNDIMIKNNLRSLCTWTVRISKEIV